MRRVLSLLGCLAATGALTLSAAPAHAAQGTVYINGSKYHEPDKRCFDRQSAPLHVYNLTDKTAYVYSSVDCTGGKLGKVGTGEEERFYNGHSVYVY
ncbi:hypothetical protein [Salinactinospora qingdaonensis]|uniref:Secreted protein n=1 Tax=Salinactinospora qingdaonensis TaxID=702744 RepID=A0ABP7FTB9_9ACTN